MLISECMRFLLATHHVLVKIVIHYRLVLVATDVHYLASTELIHPAARPSSVPYLQDALHLLRAPIPPLLPVNRELIQVLELGHDPHYVVHMILIIEVHLEVSHVRHVSLNLLTNRVANVLDQVVSEIQAFDGQSLA